MLRTKKCGQGRSVLELRTAYVRAIVHTKELETPPRSKESTNTKTPDMEQALKSLVPETKSKRSTTTQETTSAIITRATAGRSNVETDVVEKIVTEATPDGWTGASSSKYAAKAGL